MKFVPFVNLLNIHMVMPAIEYDGCLCFLQVNIWSYSSRKLMDSIETGHSANIFCTKFVPETSDELVVSGAADAEVILSWQTAYLCMTLHLN